MTKTLAQLKALWITAFKPTQQDYSDLFDSVYPTTSQPLIYEALISQSGTNTPTITAEQNNLNATITISRLGAGLYMLTSDQPVFTDTKTFPFISGVQGIAKVEYQDNSSILICTLQNVFYIESQAVQLELADNTLNKTFIGIKIYP